MRGITGRFNTSGTHTIHRRALALMERSIALATSSSRLDRQADCEDTMYEYAARPIPFDAMLRTGAVLTAIAQRRFAGLGVEHACKKLVLSGACRREGGVGGGGVSRVALMSPGGTSRSRA